jgi:hypothetical protein
LTLVRGDLKEKGAHFVEEKRAISLIQSGRPAIETGINLYSNPEPNTLFRITLYAEGKVLAVEERDEFFEMELRLSDLLAGLEFETITGFTVNRISQTDEEPENVYKEV